ncbi:MAG: EpsI family protein [Candidatus Omnitrophica bacterium]|nr:EpsI family protein [Candidatus Omnitrophota bacterium]
MNKNNIGYGIVVAVLVVASAFSLKLFFRQRAEHDIVDIRKFPMVVGEWKGKDIPISDRDYEILETRNIVLREYSNQKNEKLYLFLIYSETNRSVFHPPEVCMIGSGMTITDKATETIRMADRMFPANKLYASEKNLKQIILYSYNAGTLYTDNFYLQQVHFVWNQLFGKRKNGATIRVSMPIVVSEEETTEILSNFLKETIQALEKLQ